MSACATRMLSMEEGRAYHPLETESDEQTASPAGRFEVCTTDAGGGSDALGDKGTGTAGTRRRVGAEVVHGFRREEEPWKESHERLIVHWRHACNELAARHEAAGQRAKKMNSCFGLPAMIIPMLMAPVSTIPDDYGYLKYVEALAFVTSCVAAGLVQFFDFAGKAQRHYNFSARYADLVTDIDQEMAKPRMYRQVVDTFSLRTKMTYDALNREAPSL